MSHDENSQVSAAEQPTGDQFEVLARQVAQWTQERDRLQDLIDTAMPDAAHLASQSQAAQPSTQAAFEAWAVANGFKVERRNDADSTDTYFRHETEQRWIVWQAAYLAGQSQATRAVPEGWRAFIENCARTGGGMVNGNRLAIVAKELLAAPTAQEVTQQAAKAETTEQAEPTSEQNARFAIDAAIQYGRENRNQPPSTEHWLYEYWNIGRQLAKLGETGWDNMTPFAPTTSTVSAPDEIRSQAIEEVAKLIEEKVYAYTDECGSYDHSTGVTEYPGNGEEWVGEMGELVEEIRALKRTTSGKGEAA